MTYAVWPGSGTACCLTNCLNDLTSSTINCRIPFVDSSLSNPKSKGTSQRGSSAGSCHTDRLKGSESVSLSSHSGAASESTARDKG